MQSLANVLKGSPQAPFANKVLNLQARLKFTKEASLDDGNTSFLDGFF